VSKCIFLLLALEIFFCADINATVTEKQPILMKYSTLIFCLFALSRVFAQPDNPANQSVYLQNISWTTAREILTPNSVVLIPLGAASKEHGPHLPLSTDFIQAEYFRNQVALQRKLIIAPTFSYGFYPAFIKYPGSTSTYFSSSRDALLEVIRILAAYGPKKFYIINIGVSTTPVLETCAAILKKEGILLHYSDYDREKFVAAEKFIREKETGGHADEMESSNILYMRGDLVDMKKARDDTSNYGQPGPLTPVPLNGGKYNPSGIIGFATLATSEKGKRYAANFTRALLQEIDSLVTTPLPSIENRQQGWQKYAGTYIDEKGRTLTITIEGNRMLYQWGNGADLRNFFTLFNNSEDHFSSMAMEVVFVPDSNKEYNRIWCELRGEAIWLTRKK